MVIDALPAGTSDGGNTQILAPKFFADNFEVVNYSNSYGSLTWTTSWTEVGDDGLPNAGDIDIQTETGSGRLHLQDDTNEIYRSVNFTGYSSATLLFDRKVVSLDNGEAFYLDIYTPGSGWQNGVLSWAGPLDELSTLPRQSI